MDEVLKEKINKKLRKAVETTMSADEVSQLKLKIETLKTLGSGLDG